MGRRALAHTSRTPGKTRTCNVYDVDGRFYLVDLPGYGYARASHSERDRLKMVVRSYLSTRDSLAGVVWLLDVRRDPSPEDLDIAKLLAKQGRPVLAAITKADKLGRGGRTERVKAILEGAAIPEDQCVVTSAKTQEGIEELWEAIGRLVGRYGGTAVRR